MNPDIYCFCFNSNLTEEDKPHSDFWMINIKRRNCMMRMWCDTKHAYERITIFGINEFPFSKCVLEWSTATDSMIALLLAHSFS